MRHNQGFSLIELIVVIVIAAILISGAGVGLQYLTYSNTEKIARSIDQSLGKLQLETMSTGNQYSYLAIEWDEVEKAYFLCNVISTIQVTQTNWDTVTKTITNRKKIANSNTIISYSSNADGSNQTIIRDTIKIVLLNFKPGSGAFQSNSQLIIINTSGKLKKLQLILLTGNHYIE